MTEAERNVWQFLVNYPTAEEEEVLLATGAPPDVIRDCISRISTPREVLLDPKSHNKHTELRKHDAGKPAMDLIPPEALIAIGTVLGRAADTGVYERRNWEKGTRWGRYYAATVRHLNDWLAGKERDDALDTPVLWNAICSLAILIAYTERGIGEDDRT